MVEPIPIKPDPNFFDVIDAAMQQIKTCNFVPARISIHYKDYIILNGWNRLPRKLKKKITHA